MKNMMIDEPVAFRIVDRNMFHAELDALRVREKGYTREGDTIAADPPEAPCGRDG